MWNYTILSDVDYFFLYIFASSLTTLKEICYSTITYIIFQETSAELSYGMFTTLRFHKDISSLKMLLNLWMNWIIWSPKKCYQMTM